MNTGSNSKIKRMEKYFERFLRRTPFTEIFPREIWLSNGNFHSRHNVRDIHHFVRTVRMYSGKVNVYTSLYSLPQNLRDEMDCIFFEIDFDDLRDINVADKAICRVLDNEGLAYRRFWTGGRSIHYYIPLEPVVLYNRHWTIAEWMKRIPPYYDVRTRYCNPSQIVRVPLTTHMSTRMPMVETYDEIKDRMVDNVEQAWFVNIGLREELLEIDSEAPEPVADTPVEMVDIPVEPMCIIEGRLRMPPKRDKNGRIIRDRRGKPTGLTHDQRIHLAAFWIKQGHSDETIVKWFEPSADFDYKTTLYQVRHIRSKGYNPFRCKRVIEDLGLCDYNTAKTCPYYPSLVKTLKKRL